MSDTKEKLAEELRELFNSRYSGSEISGVPVPFSQLPKDMQDDWLRVAEHVLKREDELRKGKELAIEQLIDMAGFYCGEMECQGNPEFAIYEFAMCDCIERLKRIGIKYDPCTGKREALTAEKPESK